MFKMSQLSQAHARQAAVAQRAAAVLGHGGTQPRAVAARLRAPVGSLWGKSPSVSGEKLSVTGGREQLRG